MATPATAVDTYRLASEHLAQLDNDWARLVRLVGPCTHQPKPAREPYEALVRAVAYQQLHARAGDAIIARLLNMQPDNSFPSPQQLLAAGTEALRICGFSARKIDTIRGIAEGAISGLVPSRKAAMRMSDGELITRLVALPGIGRWTVEMLLIYTFERIDIMPADDFGVREGYRRLKSLDATPTRKEMAMAGLPCSPYRTVASWYLWRIPALKECEALQIPAR
ncbi:MAG: DNA-3-methyladenine glycosylase family protein [Noviherbaspirillum sp.]